MDPFETPRAESGPGAHALPRLEALHLEYDLRIAPMKEQLRLLLRNRTVQVFLLLTVGGLVLGVVGSPLSFIAALVGAGFLASILKNTLRSPMGRPGANMAMAVDVVPAGVMVRAAQQETTYRWMELSHYEETEHLFCIQPKQGVTVVVSKETTNLVEQERLRNWLSNLLVKGSPEANRSRRGWKTLFLWVFLIFTFWVIYHVIADQGAAEREAAPSSPPAQSR